MSDTSTALAPGPGQKLIAEFLGTFVLVFFGVGSVVILGAAGGNLSDYTGIALTFGIAVAVMIYAVGQRRALQPRGVDRRRGRWPGAVERGPRLHGHPGRRSDRGGPGPLHRGARLRGLRRHGPDGHQLLRARHRGLRHLLVGGVPARADPDRGLRVRDPRGHRLTQRAPRPRPARHRPHPLRGAHGRDPGDRHLGDPARSIGPALFGGSDALKDLWLFILAPLLGGALSGFVYPALFGRGDEPVAGSGLRFGSAPAGAVPGYGAPDAFQQQWQEGGGSPGDVAPPARPEDDDGRTQIRPQP